MRSPTRRGLPSKFAIVGMSESLREELAPRGIGVSVLCPGGVTTRIGESDRNRPDGVRVERAAFTGEEMEEAQAQHEMHGPDEVAARVLEAVREDLPYVITHPSWRPLVAARGEALLAAFDRAAARGSLS